MIRTASDNAVSSDLIKLKNGEYISLSKTESCLKSCILLDNCCCYVDPVNPEYLVALVLPNTAQLYQLAKQIASVKRADDIHEVCNNPDVMSTVLDRMNESAMSLGLRRRELPVRIKLCSEPWTPSNGLVTPSMKIRRRQIVDHYKADLKELCG